VSRADQTEHDVTRILEAVGGGDEAARDELFERVYQELRALAGGFMARERSEHTLQPTAVVNEAYLRLVGRGQPQWENRAHFFGAAAQAMRRILVDHAREKMSLKRGGDQERVELEDVGEGEVSLEELLSLDGALSELEQRDGRMAKIVELRFFAGLSVDETADALGISKRSVLRDWAAARAWLRRELRNREADVR
jgi:RNA polymerase sigma factor (TIGR02999 family)